MTYLATLRHALGSSAPYCHHPGKEKTTVRACGLSPHNVWTYIIYQMYSMVGGTYILDVAGD